MSAEHARSLANELSMELKLRPLLTHSFCKNGSPLFSPYPYHFPECSVNTKTLKQWLKQAASAAKMASLCGSSDQILNAEGSINKRELLKASLGV